MEKENCLLSEQDYEMSKFSMLLHFDNISARWIVAGLFIKADEQIVAFK